MLDRLRSSWAGYVFGTAAVTLISALVGLTVDRGQHVRSELAVFLLLIAVLVTASVYGRGPAVVAAVGAFIGFDLVFVEPVYAPWVSDTWAWLTLGLFLVTALVTGQLAGSLRQQADEARRRERETAALYEVARQVPASPLELRPLLGLILDQLAGVVPYRAGEFVLFEGDDPVVLDYRGPLPRERVVGFRLVRGGVLRAFVDEVVSRPEPTIIADLGGASLLARDLEAAGVSLPPEVRVHARAELAVPLIVRGTVIGALLLLHDRPAFFDERHGRLALAFAQQAALAVENARLYEQARGSAALEERQRLARELHDSVSQLLYGIVLNTSSAVELIEADLPRARALVQDVLALAEAGLAEMRALIFELRPESLEVEGLVAALERQAAATRARHGLTVHAELGEEPDVPLATKEALYRIAQQALQNTARHARARQVEVTLGVEDGSLTLCVADDGRGFDPSGSFPGHLGLRSMRERATAVGGILVVDSAPGQGTRIRVRAPLPVPA